MKQFGMLFAALLSGPLLAACSVGASNSPSVPSPETVVSRDPRGLARSFATTFGATLYVVNLGGSQIPNVTVYAQGKSFLRTIDEGASDPRALAIGDTGRLFVGNRTRSEHGDGNVAVYSLRGKKQVRTVPHIDGPKALAFDVAGNLYVAAGRAVRVFAPSGKSPIRIISKGFSHPDVLAFDSAGNLYVAGYGNPGGYVVSVFAPGVSTPNLTITDGLDVPTAMAFDPDGNLYVANSYAPGRYGCFIGTVTVYAPGSTTALRTISDGVCAPESLVFDSNGNLYVGNDDKYGVSVFAPGSSSPFRTITDGVNTAASMAFDKYGNLYVANTYGYTYFESGSITIYAPGSNSLLRTITKNISFPYRLIFGP